MPQLQLDIVTPERILVSQAVDSVNATGVEGEFGVLPQHAPLLAALAIGPLHYRVGDTVQYAFISGGFAEVLHNRMTIVTEVAEMAQDIDISRAEQARIRAEKRLAVRDENVDETRADAALMRAVIRMHVASKK